jgi:Flp pilus assembly protein TadG
MNDHLRHPKRPHARANQVRRWLRFIRRSEDGQAVVELALVLPILLVVVLGIVDFGRAVNYWNDENHLAEIGARYAAVGVLPSNDPSCGTQETTLSTYLVCEANLDSPELKSGTSGTTGVHGYPSNTPSQGVNNGTTGVCVSVPTNAVGQEVTVKVTVDYNWLPLPKVLGGSSTLTRVPLAGTATMRLEAPVPTNWITTASACT